MENNTTLLEIIWFTIGLICGIAAIVCLIDAILDLIWARANNVRHAVMRTAKTGVFRAIGWMTCACACIWVGGVAIMLPPIPPRVTPIINTAWVSFLQFSTIFALILLESTITVMIIMEVLERRFWNKGPSSR